MKKMRFCVFLIFIFFGCLSFIWAEENAQPTIKDDTLDTPVSQALNSLEKDKRAQPQAIQPQPTAKAEENTSVAEVSTSSGQAMVLDVLELKDMDILDVLKLISKKSGLNIVAGKNVRGKLTIFLKDVGVWDALKIIFETNELAYVQDGNIIKVMTDRDYELTYGKKFGDKTETKIIALKYVNSADLISLLTQIKSAIGKVLADEKSNTVVIMDAPAKIKEMQSVISEVDVPIVTKIFSLNYAKADDLEKKISEVLSKNIGKIKIDSRSNKIFVTDTPLKMPEVEKIIAAFDEKHREVLIEAKILKIVLNDRYKMGVNWEGIVEKFKDLDIKSSFSILSATDKKGQISIGTLANNKYTALIEALDEVGTTNTLSSPRIIALNNQEAKILVGSTEAYVTTTTTTPASGPTTTAEAVNFVDVGVKLYVTPTINKDGFITMKIRPEVSSVDHYLTTAENNQIPIVETSQAETNVMAKDGSTIVIGGLIKDELIETVKKVPLFGDLPLVGVAFRNKDRQVKKTEIVIFLTPHITSGENNAEQTTEVTKN